MKIRTFCSALLGTKGMYNVTPNEWLAGLHSL